MVSKKCLACGNVFEVYKYREHTAKFCSKKCSDLPGSRPIGENSQRWKTGKIKTVNGYICIRVNKKYIYEHRLLMERHLGRPLLKSEIVHHKNGIKDDNNIKNLELLNKKGHDKLHTSERWETERTSFLPEKERCLQPRTGRHEGSLCKRYKPCKFHRQKE
jgi:hypothetical protein